MDKGWPVRDSPQYVKRGGPSIDALCGRRAAPEGVAATLAGTLLSRATIRYSDCSVIDVTIFVVKPVEKCGRRISRRKFFGKVPRGTRRCCMPNE